jgi:hypothetical protein
MRWAAICLACLATNMLYAQPGDWGGGLSIVRICDTLGNPVLRGDKKWDVQLFSMNNTGPRSSIADTPGRRSALNWNDKDLGLTPVSLFILNDPSRVMILHEQDTMIVDFSGIPKENGSGYQAGIDTLMFLPGAYMANLTALGSPNITKHTMPELISSARLKKYNFISGDFLDPQNFTNEFLINQMKFEFYQAGDMDAAYQNALLVLANKPRKEEYFQAKMMEGLVLQHNGKYHEAVACIESIHSIENFDLTSDALIELYTQTEDFAKALELLDLRAVRRGDYSIAERARYRLKYLNDAAGAIEDYHLIIDKIPDNYMHDRLIGSSDYGYAFKELGDVYWEIDSLDLAIHNYYLSVAFYSNAQYIADLLKKLNSLHGAKAKRPFVHLTMAVANLRMCLMSYRSDPAYSDYPLRAKKLFDQCTEEEMNLALYHFHLGEFNSYQQRFDDAYQNLCRAIELDNSNARFYLLRYTVRNQMTGSDHKNAIDDQKKALELAKKWVFTK